MRKLSILLSSVLMLLLLTEAAQATSMRCGRNLISRGDHQGKVLATCGEPLIASARTIYRSGIPYQRFRSFSLSNGYYSTTTSRELIHHNRSVVEVPVDVWTYNFGPRYFMREVTFVDGRVTIIKTLGYGY